ncbi:MAG: hypothetical protein LUD80_05030 [Clostridiales bacterium]|nr:hypothetical protein [Clostridiales bacterium]
MHSLVVKALICPPMASIRAAIWAAVWVLVPLNSMCSIKWAAPDWLACSSREPVATQMPRAAERTEVRGSVRTVTPLGSVSI